MRLSSKNPEALHQVRVGLRYLDTAIRFFSDNLPKEKRAVIAEELKGFSQALSRAREVDVFLNEVICRLSRHDRLKPDIAMIERLCRFQQKREYNRVRKTLASRRFLKLLSVVQNAMAGGKDLLRQETGDPRRAATKRLKKAKTTLRDGRHLDDLGRHRLHHFRLRIKRMRYAIGFVEPLFEDNDAPVLQRAGKLLKRMQDELGTVTDRHAHGDLLKALRHSAVRPNGVGRIDWGKAKRVLFDTQHKTEEAAFKRAGKTYRKFAKIELR